MTCVNRRGTCFYFGRNWFWYPFTAEKECKPLFVANPHRIHMFKKIHNMLKNKIFLGNMSEVKVVAKIIRNLKLVMKLL
jgi:hypothetical protein